MEFILVYKKEEFVKFNEWRPWEFLQQGQDFLSVVYIATGKFTDNMKMTRHLTIEQQFF